MLVVNRDDAAGFRLDTLTTSKQYTTPTVRGMETLTTHTDYVNKYPSVLQITSYNFPQTLTTNEVCVGVVELIHKNPTQHYEDICMLKEMEAIKSVFINPVTETAKGASNLADSSTQEKIHNWTEDHESYESFLFSKYH